MMNKVEIGVLIFCVVAILSCAGIYRGDERMRRTVADGKREAENCVINDVKAVMKEYHLKNSGIMLNRQTDGSGNSIYELRIHNGCVSTLDKEELDMMLGRIDEIFMCLAEGGKNYCVESRTAVDNESITLISVQVDGNVKCASAF